MGVKPITSKTKTYKSAAVKSDPRATQDSGMKTNEPKEKSWANVIGHGALDVLGLVPVVGEAFDGVNAAWYAAEGDHTNAALSAAAMIPFAGWGATGTKLAMKGYKGLSKTAKVVDKASKTKVGKFAGLGKPNKAAKFYGPDRYEANTDPNPEANKSLGSNRVSQGASSWKRANDKSGTNLTNLIKQRNSAKKGSAEYAKAQNAINKAYGVKKRY